jgi:hypothetical protein
VGIASVAQSSHSPRRQRHPPCAHMLYTPQNKAACIRELHIIKKVRSVANVATAVKIGPFAPEGIVDLIEQQVRSDAAAAAVAPSPPLPSS